MKILLDSTVIIELERKNEDAIGLVKELIRNNEEVLISAVTASEAFVVPYFSYDFGGALAEMKQITSQFLLVSLDSEIAEKIAKYSAYLMSAGTPVEYQDAAVAATVEVTKSDYLLTQNKKLFEPFPELGSKVRTVSEFKKIYR